MQRMLFQKTAGSLLLAAGMIAAPLASAGTLTYQGVTFTFTEAANVLTLEIDAAGRTGDWTTANYIGALQVKDIGTFASVGLSGEAGPPNTTAASSWTYFPNELNSSGCAGGSSGVQRACFDATNHADRIALADNMIFHFTFTGGTQDFSDPHLKLAFYGSTGVDDNSKVGSLLSMNIPAVPEPESYGMFLMGLGILAFLARPRKA